MSYNRNHAYNLSNRPLLDQRKQFPKLISPPSGGTTPGSPINNKKSDKKKLVTVVQGLNDFQYVANQYNNLKNRPNGYPYGSPPGSPYDSIVNTSDSTNITDIDPTNNFVFSDNDSGINLQSNESSLIRIDKDKDKINQRVESEANQDDDRLNSDKHDYCKPPDSPIKLIPTKQCIHSGYKVDNSNISWRFHSPIVTRLPPLSPRLQSSTHQCPIEKQTGPFVFGVHSNRIHTPFSYVKNCDSNRYESSYSDGQQQKFDKDEISVINKKKYSKEDGANKENQGLKTNDRNPNGQGLKVRTQDRLLKKGRKRIKPDNCNNNRQTNEIKCVLIGDGAVGKTNLITTYLKNHFIQEHEPTASDIYNFTVTVNEKPIHVTLCDTAGQDTLEALRRICYQDSDVILLCFSIVQPETFQSIKWKWVPTFTDTRTPSPIVLIGTKSDLRNDSATLVRLKQMNESPVSMKDAWELAASIGATYIETSSREQSRVKEAFDTAIWDALNALNTRPTESFWKRLFCFG